MNKIKLIHLYHALNLLFLGLTAGYAVSSWGSLPDRIPVHFGFSGAANRWADRGFELILIYSIPFIITLLLYTIAFLLVPWVAEKHPEYLNIPYKEKFLALPADKRAPLWQMTGEMLSAIAACVNGLFFYLLYNMIQSAVGMTGRLHAPWMFPLIALLIAVIAGYALRIVWLNRKLTSR